MLKRSELFVVASWLDRVRRHDLDVDRRLSVIATLLVSMKPLSYAGPGRIPIAFRELTDVLCSLGQLGDGLAQVHATLLLRLLWRQALRSAATSFTEPVGRSDSGSESSSGLFDISTLSLTASQPGQ